MDRIFVGTTTKADRLLLAGLVDLQPVFNALQGSVLIVGGLMTKLWLHAQPIGLPARATADVDLGIDRRRLQLAATSKVIRPLLEKHGFDAGGGQPGEPFRFSKEFTGGQKLLVDLLVASGASRSEPPLLEKDLTSLAAPGLAYAFLRGVYVMPVDFFDDGETSGFDLPLPHLDAAFVMKAELTRSGMRSRADRRRTDTVDAMSLAASCLDRPDCMEALKTHRTRSDVRGALRWIAESFGGPKTAAARRVEEHFRQEFGRAGSGEWAVDVARRFVATLDST